MRVCLITKLCFLIYFIMYYYEINIIIIISLSAKGFYSIVIDMFTFQCRESVQNKNLLSTMRSVQFSTIQQHTTESQ